MKYFVDFLTELKKGNVFPVYLFYGPETYLREQAVLRLRETLLPPGGSELNYEVLDGETVPVREIVAAARHTPFISGRRLVVVRNPGLFQPAQGKNDGDEKHLLEYLAGPHAGTCLVFNTAQGVDRRKKVYKEVARVGRAIEFTRLRPAELAKWLAKLAREEECALSREAAEELLARCGQDMYTLYHEMRKLTCHAGRGKEISPAMVRELVAGRVEENIFEVVDAIGSKDCVRALSGVRNLLLQKHQPQQITGMVARQFRLILQVRGLLESGRTRDEIIALLKMHPYVYRKIYQQRNNFSTGRLVRCINELAELDYRVKTGRTAFYPAMETLILKICAEK
jgi:DNA polymerase-3 subunit delta